MPFPEGGLVYDYSLDDGGASRKADAEEEEEKKEEKKAKKTSVSIDPEICTLNFHSVIIQVGELAVTI